MIGTLAAGFCAATARCAQLLVHCYCDGVLLLPLLAGRHGC